MDDAADHPSVIDPRNAAYLVRQQRPKPLELFLTQPKLAQIHAPATEEPESHQRGLGKACLWVWTLVSLHSRIHVLVVVLATDFVKRQDVEGELAI